MHFPVIMIDGVEYAGETMIVAAGITADGTKRVLGLRPGATENAAVCVALLEDLEARGLDTNQPVLLVLDGAKALRAAAKRVWGPKRTAEGTTSPHSTVGTRVAPGDGASDLSFIPREPTMVRSQTLTVPSRLPETSSRPSGLNARVVTRPV